MNRIPTRTRACLPERLLRELYYLFERSWFAVACFYALILAFAIAINWERM